MTMYGDIAVQIEMKRILELMDRIKDRPAAEQLSMIRQYIEETKKAAETGYL